MLVNGTQLCNGNQISTHRTDRIIIVVTFTMIVQHGSLIGFVFLNLDMTLFQRGSFDN